MAVGCCEPLLNSNAGKNWWCLLVLEEIVQASCDREFCLLGWGGPGDTFLSEHLLSKKDAGSQSALVTVFHKNFSLCPDCWKKNKNDQCLFSRRVFKSTSNGETYSVKGSATIAW